MAEGGCLCGTVRYRVEGEPLASGICHCHTCRRAASAPNLPFAGFAISNFAFTRGRPVEFRSSPHDHGEKRTIVGYSAATCHSTPDGSKT